MVGPVMVRLVSSNIDQDILADTKTNRLIWIQILKFTALSSCVYTKAPTSGPVMVVLVSGLIDQPGSRSPLAPLRHSTAPHEASCQASVPASASSQSPHPLLALHITSNPSNQESYLPVSEFLQHSTAAVALILKKMSPVLQQQGFSLLWLRPLTFSRSSLTTHCNPPPIAPMLSFEVLSTWRSFFVKALPCKPLVHLGAAMSKHKNICWCSSPRMKY